MDQQEYLKLIITSPLYILSIIYFFITVSVVSRQQINSIFKYTFVKILVDFLLFYTIFKLDLLTSCIYTLLFIIIEFLSTFDKLNHDENHVTSK